jgi:hypothetical protein
MVYVVGKREELIGSWGIDGQLSGLSPQRVDKWRTNLHCSYERLCSSKFLETVNLDSETRQKRFCELTISFKIVTFDGAQ